MKLSRLFVIALLAGTLGVFGCSDDDPNGNGGSGGDGAAGSGGGVADPCAGGNCAGDADLEAACEAGVEYCKSLGAGGAGGAGGAPTDEQCDAAGSAFCNVDTGTGGTGGTGGNPGNCDYTVEQVCNVDTCDDDTQIDACETGFEDCLAAPPSANACEKCAVIALAICGGI